MILEVCWDGLWTLSFGLSNFHGHGSWLVCEVALNAVIFVMVKGTDVANVEFDCIFYLCVFKIGMFIF